MSFQQPVGRTSSASVSVTRVERGPSITDPFPVAYDYISCSVERRDDSGMGPLEAKALAALLVTAAEEVERREGKAK